MNTRLLAVLLSLGLAVTGIANADAFDDLGRSSYVFDDFGSSDAFNDLGPISVRVENGSSHTIKKLYLSASDDSDWGRDLLGSDVLRSGYEGTFLKTPGVYDLKLVDGNDRVCKVLNVEMTEDRSVTLTTASLLRCEYHSG